jgi:site-specific DNA-methyltransferase (adenine-specific)
VRPYHADAGITIYHGDWRGLSLGHFATVLTDPPYGDDHDTDYTRFSGGKTEEGRGTYERIHEDDEPFDPVPLLGLAEQVVMFGANRYSDRLPCGSWLVWNKRTPYGSKGVMSDAEVAWWNRGRGVYLFDHMWDGFNRASERGTSYHPTQKPVALMRWCLEKTRTSGHVLDPYCGSGPVGVACRDMGLPATLCDKREQYCEIAARRLDQQSLDLGGAA